MGDEHFRTVYKNPDRVTDSYSATKKLAKKFVVLSIEK